MDTKNILRILVFGTLGAILLLGVITLVGLVFFKDELNSAVLPFVYSVF